jgi:two-component system, response regulator
VRERPLADDSPSTVQEIPPDLAHDLAATTEWEPPSGDSTEPQAQPDAGGALEPRPDVLVVEDDEDEVRIIQRAIRRKGLESRFKIMHTGEDALDYLHALASNEGSTHASLPKLVMLDLKLTGIGGEEVLRQIRADERLHALPIVIVSSSRSERDIRDCYRLGANSFVRKHCGHEAPGEHVLVIARYWLDFNQPSPS